MNAQADAPTGWGRWRDYFASSPSRYRAQIALRAWVAIVGGYVLAAATAIILAHALIGLDVARNDATLAGNLLAFMVHPLAVLWVFACAPLARACLPIVLPAVVLALLALFLTYGVQS